MIRKVLFPEQPSPSPARRQDKSEQPRRTSPSYSITAVIANEFSEATSDVYISALIEVGFVLFCITIIVNAFARLLILGITRKASRQA